MLKHFLHYLLFAFTMFAAADVSLGGEGGGGTDGAHDAGSGTADLSGDFGEADTDGGTQAGEDEGADAGDDGLESELDGDAAGSRDQERSRPQEVDKDTADLKGLVSRRILALKKEAPGLTDIFKEHPKVQEQIEAAFRRDMGYRELGTIADFRAFREEFPGGVPDVQELRSTISEFEQVDQNFYARDPQGNYAGHPTLLQNLYNDDRTAAVALFRTVPKEWARLDPDSYNEVMGAVVGATLQRAELPEWLTELRDAAKTAKQDSIAASLDKMLRWATGFQKRKPEPTEDERRLQGQREQFQRETAERQKQDSVRFDQNFSAQSRQLQDSIIRKHPAVAQLLATKALPDTKKTAIIEKIRVAIVNHLKQSTAFKNKLTPLYRAGKLKEALDVQRVSWSYPWILNKFVRSVLNEETPALVRQNRERVRGAAPGSQRQPVRGQQQQQSKDRPRTEPYKENGTWYSKEGRRLSTAEILRGAVPDALASAK